MIQADAKDWICFFLLDKEEREKFCKFAFGDDYEEVSLCKLHIRWNERHGDKYTVSGDRCPKDDLPEMIMIFRDQV